MKYIIVYLMLLLGVAHSQYNTYTKYNNGKIAYSVVYDTINMTGVERHYYTPTRISAEIPFKITNDCEYKYPLTFSCGIEHGVFKSYYKNGNIQLYVPYYNGKEHGVGKAWNYNGTIRWVTTYEHGIEHGMQYWYGDDGVLDASNMYRYGIEQPNVRHNTYRSSSNPYVAENGDMRGYDNDGNGRRERVYVRGYYRKDGTYVRSHYRASPRR